MGELADGRALSIDPWMPGGDTWLDRAIAATRQAAFPLLGLDPHDPRD
jgi:acetoin utilization protein AcuC